MAKRAKQPTDQQFETAIMWLRSNDGDDGEAVACGAVADWIERGRVANELRQLAREAGIPVSQVRKRLSGKGDIEPEMEN